ncbi:MAG: DUF1987 domain-containing protein [Petrotogaceae bacterium]|nr:DUF1987 domain-containing protein [Petrotogaceae bacterium]
MNDLIIEKTQSTPYINFSHEQKKLFISGESFPENAAKFYAPILEWIKQIINDSNTDSFTADFEIVYFNSSTSKVFMTIFDTFENAVKKGMRITVNWRCDSENETAIECGEEFKEDLSTLPFNIVLVKGVENG